MLFVLRRTLAVISLAAFACMAFVYADSYFGLSRDAVNAPIVLLYVVAVAIGLAAHVYERFAGAGNGPSLLPHFFVAKASWLKPVLKGLLYLAAFHFVYFLIGGHAATPEELDGHYVLSDHGTIRAYLTRSDYLARCADEIRLFAGGGCLIFSVFATYWWYPSVRPTLNPYDEQGR